MARRPPVAAGLRLVGVHPGTTAYAQPAVVAQATAAPQPTSAPPTATPRTVAQRAVSSNVIAPATETPVPSATYARASYTVAATPTPTPTAGTSNTSTTATLPGGNAHTYFITGYTATGSLTASGTTPHWGTVAVDTSVIPMHSTVYIQGLGVFTAEDTGGAVRGYHIDVFVSTSEQAYALTGYRLVSFIPPDAQAH